MTIGEANDFNTVMQYFLNTGWNGCAVPDEDTARQAVGRLAERSHKPLMAGLRATDVDRLWPQRRGAEAA